MKHYLLDTSALLTLRDDEQGANQVDKILLESNNGQIKVYASFITLMEIYYRVWKDEGEVEGRLAYEQCTSLPIVWVDETRELLELAVKIKATHPLSLADAWIAATAILKHAILVHKDPEFENVTVEQLKLPYKAESGSQPRNK